eukprot:2280541-Rhodomonas_salina.4
MPQLPDLDNLVSEETPRMEGEQETPRPEGVEFSSRGKATVSFAVSWTGCLPRRLVCARAQPEPETFSARTPASGRQPPQPASHGTGVAEPSKPRRSSLKMPANSAWQNQVSSDPLACLDVAVSHVNADSDCTQEYTSRNSEMDEFAAETNMQENEAMYKTPRRTSHVGNGGKASEVGSDEEQEPGEDQLELRAVDPEFVIPHPTPLRLAPPQHPFPGTPAFANMKLIASCSGQRTRVKERLVHERGFFLQTTVRALHNLCPCACCLDVCLLSGIISSADCSTCTPTRSEALAGCDRCMRAASWWCSA